VPLVSWLPDLTDASGFALFAGGVIVIGWALWTKRLVVGWIYQDKVDEAKRLQIALDQQIAVNVALTNGLRDEPPRRRADHSAP